ncbi:LPXTG cell wall anchor domain-containing protein [Streptomyces sp. NBC_00237]|uniref:SCO1860 family LAETG-anchored protein n=1 Tax=Streptomyces sp. NBC_00237 TaxID=2975687 RepID=UPI0022502D43|nr:SCO1860 family LAETG-anchored protein [Streptomyces sp. NBC_00237]MCX5202013.1 LPXTG cell wall anchor domain-containing protein [Streptomyces sp. NBC_00237]
MNSSLFRMPAFGPVAGAVTLLALTAGPAQATDHPSEKGTAQASVLKAGLEVSLLNKTLHVPVTTSLNEVRAPGSAARTALTVTVDGVNQGQPVSMLRAEVAKAAADVQAERAEARAELARAKVHVPGLPLLSLIEVEKVTSRSSCVAGARPEAEANALGRVTVLGKRVTLTAGGPTRVRVPAVGEVSLTLSKTHTTTREAAAAALELKVSVNPLKLNVAEVEGVVTLASTACTVPNVQTLKSPPSEAPLPQTVTADPVNLAETGGSSTTPYLVGGGLLLLAAGGVAVARGRRG